MQSDKIIASFKSKYPGCEISCIPRLHPTEIICEVEPSSTHPDYSIAVVAIKKSAPHFHRIITETYEIIEGELVVHLNNVKHILHKGEKITISPEVHHWAEGDFTFVKVTSRPGWTLQDHFVV